MERKRRRAVRKADVDYDRSADAAPNTQANENPALDAEREVLLGDEEPGLTGRDFYEAERPPHYGD
ncbi:MULTISPECIES: hypothetical protein [Corynebacterium]|uniref:Uncharacterized protein n=2 Tax=Corynebacterium TaxID=1716 RepID=A0A7W2I2M6_9CORY|nr:MULTISPECIES: hypothetical protein [Corynebacterium]MBA5243227.1 hypothetical protein [Corynebacterium haemomassiliense]MCZ9291449.1 hypothetical protein [Corynebacterium lehmanniae]